ncbi:hypothetical protein [Rhizobium gallicum]|nr:hypothetical protein [Rhizobium gallicum]
MTEVIPASVVERLEREWRMVDRDRPAPLKPEAGHQQEMAPRLKIGRVD